MITNNDVFNKIKKILGDNFKINSTEVKLNSRLAEDLGLDSVELMDAMMLLEDELHVDLTEKKQNEGAFPSTVNELIEFAMERKKISAEDK
jgi:acyl carrier protein